MSDRILFSIGEALIDMIPSRVGCSFDEVPAFSPRVGGAPANVCAAVARLGGRSALLSQLGDDPFGHKIARALAGCGVEILDDGNVCRRISGSHPGALPFLLCQDHPEGKVDGVFRHLRYFWKRSFLYGNNADGNHHAAV